jgi:hypothetical protein
MNGTESRAGKPANLPHVSSRWIRPPGTMFGTPAGRRSRRRWPVRGQPPRGRAREDSRPAAASRLGPGARHPGTPHPIPAGRPRPRACGDHVRGCRSEPVIASWNSAPTPRLSGTGGGIPAASHDLMSRAPCSACSGNSITSTTATASSKPEPEPGGTPRCSPPSPGQAGTSTPSTSTRKLPPRQRPASSEPGSRA